ncbi:glycoside hydrolase family 95 protein [Niveispirillum irakense]|uniref:glycoside hydrolase family 95 protein n=1 Tax=Niveispirillum irakense TaxID=34011 RepID=UPI000406FE88|nr:glycoside hydrolase family 95 protein [Niveispirillum irakense]
MAVWTRRAALKGMGMATLAASNLSSSAWAAGPDEHEYDPLTLWYKKPAQEWVEALPLGNGRLGAMVFGGTGRERLQLNEDTLWGGGPYDPTHADALPALPEVRALIEAGKYLEAQELAGQKLMARPIRQMSYQTVGDLWLDFPDLGPVTDYHRDLNLDTAVARSRFRAGNVWMMRECFISPVDQVLVMRLTADQPGQINVDLSFATPQPGKAVAEGDDILALRGTNTGQHGNKPALKFTALARVLPSGGKVGASDKGLSVRGADQVVILVAAATSYRRFDDVSGDPDAIARGHIDAAAAKTRDQMLASHLASHRNLFRRVTIDLGTSPAARLPTDQRVRESASLTDPALAALYYQFGRYLLICSSRPGTQPANLQGIWNDKLNPPWGSKYTININTQMNYWPAEPTNLAECVKPLIQLIRDVSITGARTAKVMYGARGWMVHHNTDLWRATGPIDGAKFGIWPMGGAWLCLHLWDHYDYSRDRAFLDEAYPLMKGAAEFFLDTLVEDKKTGFLVTNPSLSPENAHPFGSSLVAGPAMDSQILRDLFDACIRSSEILDKDADFRAEVARTRARLPPDRIGKAGQLQEWIEDWDMEAPSMDHRHVSHLYGLFPSGQIDPFETPELAAAAKRSLQIRGDKATGWGIGWRLNLWARLGDGEHAHQVLRLLLEPDRTYPNLFDSHPPFQIDGNFGGTSGITEMVLRSRKDVIHLLPSLPSAWPNGQVNGLRARGAVDVSLRWRGGRLDYALVSSRINGSHKLRYRDQVIDLVLRPNQPVRVGLAGGRLVAQTV